MSTYSRLARILRVGELLGRLYVTDKELIANYCPVTYEKISSILDLPEPIECCAKEWFDRLRSAARGGAKMALGLMMAHYPDIKIWRVSRCSQTKMPTARLIQRRCYLPCPAMLLV